MSSPEMLSIALGLLMALGIFALKTAVGGYYFLALPGPAVRKTVSIVLMQLSYVVLFLAAFPFLRKIDFFRAGADSSAFLKNGILIHLLLCGGLIWWGVCLLVRKGDGTPDCCDSKGWLLLAFPCPVCAAAIVLVCAFGLMLFPGFAESLRWLVPLAFLALELVFLGGLFLLGKVFRIRPLVLTGRMMILIALYFILILLIAPQFQTAGKLYAAACASGRGEVFSLRHLLTAGSIILAAAGGFCWDLLHEKRS